jgi:predicted N-acyltransferase
MDIDKKIHPFANKQFLDLLENSHCVNESSGWMPHHFETAQSLLAAYIKFHSYGEYIFDWAWANFYQNNNLQYYPKLLHAIPFTPVNAPKFIGQTTDFKKLAQMSFDFYQSHNLSGEHYLFISDEEEKILNELDFSFLLTHQYHFHNHYESFDHFLSCLKKNKRKNIKKRKKGHR